MTTSRSLAVRIEDHRTQTSVQLIAWRCDREALMLGGPAPIFWPCLGQVVGAPAKGRSHPGSSPHRSSSKTMLGGSPAMTLLKQLQAKSARLGQCMQQQGERSYLRARASAPGSPELACYTQGHGSEAAAATARCVRGRLATGEPQFYSPADWVKLLISPGVAAHLPPSSHILAERCQFLARARLTV